MNLAVTFLASFLIWLLYAGLLILWLWDGRIKKELILHALVTSLGAWLIAQIIKSLFPTIRPFLVSGVNPLTLSIPLDSAFPSGHAAASFGLAMTLWLHNRKIGWIYLVAAILIGISRVLSNVHYPLDILGGALLGIIIALITERMHIFKTKKVVDN